MIEAPSIKEVNEHREKNSTAICCILFAPKFSKVGYEEINFNYVKSFKKFIDAENYFNSLSFRAEIITNYLL